MPFSSEVVAFTASHFPHVKSKKYNNKLAPMTSEDYNFYSLVANALSAAGTFFASVVALYLAVRKTKLQQKEMVKIEIEIATQSNICGAKTFIGIKHCINDCQKWSIEDLFLSISVYNTGFKCISLKTIALESTENFEINYISGAAFNKKYENIKIESGDMLFRAIPLAEIINSQHVISQYKKIKKPQKTFYIAVSSSKCNTQSLGIGVF